MSRYKGNGEACPVCGLTYGQFRTGFAWEDIWGLFYTAPDADPSTWVRKNRGRILGRWHQIKKELWAEHLEVCGVPALPEEPIDQMEFIDA